LHRNQKDGRVRATAARENGDGYTAAFVANHHPSKSITDPAQATFTKARQTIGGHRPQAIAHRGYKASHPENTISAFKGAVEVGAHAIETDIHVTKDGIVVLSHVGAGTSIGL
jgi:glycerophosphoryl diester phosphodiesterase